MHDPLVVAWEVKLPWPKRKKWRDARPGDRRWTLGRMRRTNPENLGEPCYPWYRPAGYEVRIAGRAFALKDWFTIWHVEPKGRDAFTVCKQRRQKHDGTWVYSRRWAWHVWHWRIQWAFPPIGTFKRFMWSRCAECERRFPWNYAPVSHQWDGPGPKWFRGEPSVYHHQCSGLIGMRRTVEEDEQIIRLLIADLRLQTDESEEEVVARLTDSKNRSFEFRYAYRLTRMLGYERDDNYRLVRARSGRDAT